MIVLKDIDKLAPFQNDGLVVAIGNFDGVHFGHRQLLKATIEKAALLQTKSMALTFDPHPARLFKPSQAPKMLISQEQKAELIHEMGLDILLFIKFNHEFAGLAPEDFVKEILQRRIRPKAVLVGFNFTFGRHGSGNTDILIEMGKTSGFEVEVIKPVTTTAC